MVVITFLSYYHQCFLLYYHCYYINHLAASGIFPPLISCAPTQSECSNEMLDIVLEMGAEINKSDSSGRTPLMVSVIRKSLSMSAALLVSPAKKHTHILPLPHSRTLTHQNKHTLHRTNMHTCHACAQTGRQRGQERESSSQHCAVCIPPVSLLQVTQIKGCGCSGQGLATLC